MSNTQKQELWNERIQDFRTSGLSQKAWCEEHGLQVGQLGYWLRKSKTQASSSNGRWLSLDTIALPGSGISLRIGSMVLEIERGFDQEVLADVVRSLMAVC